MARDRDDDIRDDDAPPPRRRDDDDAPRSRRRDDDDDRPVALGPLDKTFRDTNIVLLVIFSLCCNGIALILGLIGLFTAKDPTAKKNATLVTIIGGVVTVVGIIIQVVANMSANVR